MNKLCEILKDNINLDYNISYYIKQSDEDIISFNCDDPYDTIDYICENLKNILLNYYQDIIIYYNNNSNIIILYNKRQCTITKQFLNNNCIYWILYIDLI